jgi:hypothetical protein
LDDALTVGPQHPINQALENATRRAAISVRLILQFGILFVASLSSLYVLSLTAHGTIIAPFPLEAALVFAISGLVILNLFSWIAMRSGSVFVNIIPFFEARPRRAFVKFEDSSLFARMKEFTAGESYILNKKQCLEDVDKRIGATRRRSTLMLTTIGILLVGAALVVVYAGNLTSLDVSANSNVDKLQKLIDAQESRLGQLSSVLFAVEQRKGGATDLADTIFARLDIVVPRTEAEIRSDIDIIKDRLQGLQVLYQQAWLREVQAEHGYGDTKYLVATAVTRVAVVFIIVFLVQILINLYRYNTRLGTFYTSNRDALQLWDGKTTKFADLQKVLAPNIDFGKEPKHPIEEIVRQVISKIPTLGPSGAVAAHPQLNRTVVAPE